MKKRPCRKHGLALRRELVAVFVVSACTGCGETSSEVFPLSCGPGTVESGSACVPVDSGGGDSSGDEGHPPGDAPEESELEADVVSVDAPTPSDAPEGSVAAIYAAEEQNFGDPCPTEPLLVNCGADCGGMTPNCQQTTCGAEGPAIMINDASMLPAVMRTPDRPGKLCECSDGTVFAMRILVQEGLPHSGPVNLRATLGPPWQIASGLNWSSVCQSAQTQYDECLLTDYGTSSSPGRAFVFSTNDPDAPARNIRIELVGVAEGCQ